MSQFGIGLALKVATRLAITLVCASLLGMALADEKLAPPETPEGWAERLKDQRFQQTSPWGPESNGLQLRVTAPTRIEQNMDFSIATEVQATPGNLAEGTKSWNPSRAFPNFCLYLQKTTGGIFHKIERPVPYVPGGLDDTGRDVVTLDGTAQVGPAVEFRLVFSEPELEPGKYVGFVRYRHAARPSEDEGVYQADIDTWAAKGHWAGKVDSGEFALEILPEAMRTATIAVPTKLRVIWSPRYFDEDGNQLGGGDFRMVTFAPEDSETITAAVHNGFHLMHEVLVPHEGHWRLGRLSGGLPEAYGRNGIHQLQNYNDTSGDYSQSFRIVIKEANTIPHRPDGPLKQYVLWQRDFDVWHTAEQMRNAPQAPPIVIQKREPRED